MPVPADPEEYKTSTLIQGTGSTYKANTLMITEERGLKFQLMQIREDLCVREQY